MTQYGRETTKIFEMCFNKMKKIFILLIILLKLNNCDLPTDLESTDPLVINSSVAIYGDTQDQFIHTQIFRSILDTNPKAIFHVGDMVHTQSDWDIFFDVINDRSSNIEFYPALGNHDENALIFFEYFNLPNNEKWYSVDIEITHFIILDSNDDISVDSEQFKWLENDLLNANLNPTVKYIAVIFHHPVYSSVAQHSDEKNFKANVIPLFEKYGVDIVFSGHAHNYERSFNNGITYVVTGGGGGSIHEMTKKNNKSIIFSPEYHFCILYYIDGEMVIEAVYKYLSKNFRRIDRFSVK